MKKFIFGVVCSFAMAMAFTACGNKNVETTDTDSVATDTTEVVADTVAVDTAEVVAE